MILSVFLRLCSTGIYCGDVGVSLDVSMGEDDMNPEDPRTLQMIDTWIRDTLILAGMVFSVVSSSKGRSRSTKV